MSFHLLTKESSREVCLYVAPRGFTHPAQTLVGRAGRRDFARSSAAPSLSAYAGVTVGAGGLGARQTNNLRVRSAKLVGGGLAEPSRLAVQHRLARPARPHRDDRPPRLHRLDGSDAEVLAFGRVDQSRARAEQLRALGVGNVGPHLDVFGHPRLVHQRPQLRQALDVVRQP
eukprot:scaffold12381_cov117-Isochrysis_galbana.AAC.2